MNESHSFSDTAFQLYLKETQHCYNLKVFQCKIKIVTDLQNPQNQNKIDELKISEDYFYLYGSIHIESDVSISLQLNKEIIIFRNNENEKDKKML